METFIIIILGALALIGWLTVIRLNSRRRVSAMPTFTETRISHLEEKVGAIYRHLNVRYQEIPMRGEAVTISPLSSLGGIGQALARNAKSNKERSA